MYFELRKGIYVQQFKITFFYRKVELFNIQKQLFASRISSVADNIN